VTPAALAVWRLLVSEPEPGSELEELWSMALDLARVMSLDRVARVMRLVGR
jgi:hypothetical protein